MASALASDRVEWAASDPVASGVGTQRVMVLVSIVTAPFRAKALPQLSVAPVFRVMLVSARMLPWNAVFVPSVAELPTTQ